MMAYGDIDQNQTRERHYVIQHFDKFLFLNCDQAGLKRRNTIKNGECS